ncbi:MAG: hypothetical protein FP815_13290 [Desulfobulbaceae bacterium]|nr:hypothetical protein [Desulfobulbaceae bacterium]MDP2105487.1 hypothetical protein [Desulfobulbaceae bacterium]
MKKSVILFFWFTAFWAMSINVSAETIKNMALVKARVTDVDKKPVKGAYIFFYDSADTKRAVDLVSPVTDQNGYCEKEVPPGQFWVLARLKSNATFDMGPLMIEDKFSGDPIEIEVTPGEVLELDFTVMDLLDTIKNKSKKREDLNKVSGRVINDKGEPLTDVFAFANKHQSPLSVPDFFSASTENDGRFIVYLPNGNYNLGAAVSLTSDQRYKADQPIKVAGNLDNLEVILVGVKNKPVEETVVND